MPTKIEWAEETWNPVTGCTKISDGCRNCYAERMAKRLAGRFGYPADEPFCVTLHPDRLEQPFKWKKPRRIFVCSMGDLFHDDVPYEFIEQVFSVIGKTPQHTYLILTKRPENMWEVVRELEYLLGMCFDDLFPNVWLGVTAENQEQADKRILLLLQIPASVRFVSCEPLLEPIDNLWHYMANNSIYKAEFWNDSGHKAVERKNGIVTATTNDGTVYEDGLGLHWLIIGCESGPRRRPMSLDWARQIVSQCKHARVPVFIKQLPINGRVSHEPKEWPIGLRIREYPCT